MMASIEVLRKHLAAYDAEPFLRRQFFEALHLKKFRRFLKTHRALPNIKPLPLESAIDLFQLLMNWQAKMDSVDNSNVALSQLFSNLNNFWLRPVFSGDIAFFTTLRSHLLNYSRYSSVFIQRGRYRLYSSLQCHQLFEACCRSLYGSSHTELRTAINLLARGGLLSFEILNILTEVSYPLRLANALSQQYQQILLDTDIEVEKAGAVKAALTELMGDPTEIDLPAFRILLSQLQQNHSENYIFIQNLILRMKEMLSEADASQLTSLFRVVSCWNVNLMPVGLHKICGKFFFDLAEAFRVLGEITKQKASSLGGLSVPVDAQSLYAKALILYPQVAYYGGISLYFLRDRFDFTLAAALYLSPPRQTVRKLIEFSQEEKFSVTDVAGVGFDSSVKMGAEAPAFLLLSQQLMADIALFVEYSLVGLYQNILPALRRFLTHKPGDKQVLEIVTLWFLGTLGLSNWNDEKFLAVRDYHRKNENMVLRAVVPLVGRNAFIKNRLISLLEKNPELSSTIIEVLIQLKAYFFSAKPLPGLMFANFIADFIEIGLQRLDIFFALLKSPQVFEAVKAFCLLVQQDHAWGADKYVCIKLIVLHPSASLLVSSLQNSFEAKKSDSYARKALLKELLHYAPFKALKHTHRDWWVKLSMHASLPELTSALMILYCGNALSEIYCDALLSARNPVREACILVKNPWLKREDINFIQDCRDSELGYQILILLRNARVLNTPNILMRLREAEAFLKPLIIAIEGLVLAKKMNKIIFDFLLTRPDQSLLIATRAGAILNKSYPEVSDYARISEVAAVLSTARFAYFNPVQGSPSPNIGKLPVELLTSIATKVSSGSLDEHSAHEIAAQQFVRNKK